MAGGREGAQVPPGPAESPGDARAYPSRPWVGVGGVVVRPGQVLLIRRGQPPSRGAWSIPGGMVEAGESLPHAVAREVLEETGVIVTPGQLLTAFDVIQHDPAGRVALHYVVLDYLCRWESGDPVAGTDADAALWLDWDVALALDLAPRLAAVLQQARALAAQGP